VVEETPDTRTLVFDVPDDLRELYRYRSGQFCTVRHTIDGASIQRCYSMSSAPATDDHLAVTVKRVPGGIVSNWLHDGVSVGDELELMPPAGVFCPDDDGGPILAFAGGSGVTPVFSIIKQVLATTDRRIRLLDANRDDGSIIFRAALDELAAAHPDRFTVRHHVDAAAGYLAVDDIVDFVGDDIDGHVFICGPAPFMDLVEQGVAGAGIGADSVAIERFVVTEPEGEAAREAAADGVKLVVTIRRTRHELDHVEGDTILEATRRAALNAPFSCEQGNCATCMAMLTDGSVTMRANNVLTADEVEEGWILTCQAIPDSPLVAVEYEDL
jgi:ferredoxin-NADP reductase